MTPKERDPAFALRACVLQKTANGMSRADAEASCREKDMLVKNAQARGIFQPKASNNAPANMPTQSPSLGQMVGAGPLKVEYSIKAADGASIGSGAVVREDPVKAVSDWAKSLGRKPSIKDRASWGEYAKRLNMTPDDEAKGWKAVEWVESVFGALRKALGVSEATAWGGYSVPHIGMIRMQPSTGPASIKAPDSPAWGPPEASFPFHTASAGKVWAAAKKNTLKYKTSNEAEILRQSIEDSGISPAELTPEDAQLLGMAIRYLQNGPPSALGRAGVWSGGRILDKS